MEHCQKHRGQIPCLTTFGEGESVSENPLFNLMGWLVFKAEALDGAVDVIVWREGKAPHSGAIGCMLDYCRAERTGQITEDHEKVLCTMSTRM